MTATLEDTKTTFECPSCDAFPFANAEELADHICNSYVAPTPKLEVRTNKYGGRCLTCNKWIEEGAGAIEKVDGKWRVRHLDPADPACVPEAAQAPAVAAEKVTLDEGFYLVNEDIYKLQYGKESGKLYAKKLVAGEQDGKPHGHFDFAPGALHLVRSEGLPLTLAQAQEFGHKFSFCAICGAFLENTESVERGIGPVCFAKFGG